MGQYMFCRLLYLTSYLHILTAKRYKKNETVMLYFDKRWDGNLSFKNLKKNSAYAVEKGYYVKRCCIISAKQSISNGINVCSDAN